MIPDGGASLLAPFLLAESWGLFMLLAGMRNWSMWKFLKLSFIFCAVLAFVASMGHARSLGYVPIAEIQRAQRALEQKPHILRRGKKWQEHKKPLGEPREGKLAGVPHI